MIKFLPKLENAMRLMLIAAVIAIGVLAMEHATSAADAKTAKSKASEATPLDQEMKTLQGKKVNLADKYDGKVVLLVNVASKCGYTKQYAQLQALHEKYGKKGLAVVGVPCNQFGGQEPGTEKEIAQFCEDRFGVEFDMMAKVDVNGPKATPLYKELTLEEEKAKFPGKIKWNFEKFVFGRDGQVVARFPSNVEPDAKEVVEVIEAELGKKSQS
jgi:glutathione peroxidase